MSRRRAPHEPDPAGRLCDIFDEHRVAAHFGAVKPAADLYPEASANLVAREGHERGVIERPGALVAYAKWKAERGLG